MSRTVFYLMSGAAHAPYLVVSLYTLRQFWDGPIELYCWPESVHIGEYIGADNRLDITVVERKPQYRRDDGIGGNSQFLDKIDLTRKLTCDVSLYLDLDTSIHGDLIPLFEAAEEYGFAATQWNNWTTANGIAHKRVKELYNIQAIPNDLVDKIVNSKWPSVNGGVWAAQPKSPVLSMWHAWTLACRNLFIADERCLHVLQALFCPTKQMVTLCEEGRYNSSPRYQAVPDDQVVVRHYHGDSNVRPKKSQRGFELWWPLYLECRLKNIGGINDWRGLVENKYLDPLEKEFSK